MTRIVVESPDGRRLGIEAEAFDSIEGNPFNYSRPIARNDGSVGWDGGRDKDLHVSLRDEGFVHVADVDENGHEVPVDEKLYRGDGLDKASKPTAGGKRAAAEHAERRGGMEPKP